VDPTNLNLTYIMINGFGAFEIFSFIIDHTTSFSYNNAAFLVTCKHHFKNTNGAVDLELGP
jgi:hypothetical protein